MVQNGVFLADDDHHYDDQYDKDDNDENKDKDRKIKGNFIKLI